MVLVWIFWNSWKLSNEFDRTLKNNKYDDQITIFGNDIQQKLSDLNIFMIGAGALGCEFLKNFSLMGIAINNKKEVIVTDNDNIEFSNLNRQFLFRKRDIGKSKSKCAYDEAKKIILILIVQTDNQELDLKMNIFSMKNFGINKHMLLMLLTILKQENI